MKSWDIGVNSIHKTASYILIEAPWYTFVLESIVMNICGRIPCIPLLSKNYDDLHDWFHSTICSPITYWCNRKTSDIFIEADYDEIKRKYKDNNPELFQFEDE